MSVDSPLRHAPILETARLRLRGHGLNDFDVSFAMWTDPGVVRFIGGKPASREEVWARVLRYAGHWALLGFGYWLVEEKDSGRFVGEVGFADAHREISPSIDGAPEIGWALIPSAQGRGYALEAVKAIVEWGTRAFGGRRTVCLIDPDNVRSIRIAQQVGYREFARTTYKGAPSILFER